MTVPARLAMPPIATVDVPRLPAVGALRRAADIVWNVVIVTLLVLALPLVVVIGAPLALLAFIGVVTAQRFQGPRP